MAFPKVVVQDRNIILLSGYKDNGGKAGAAAAPVTIDEEERLWRAVRKQPDAVAFGYVAGHWIAGA